MLALLAGGPAVAQADTKQKDILVLDEHGHVRAHRATAAQLQEAPPPRGATARATTARKSKTKTVARELKRLSAAGAITPEQYTQYRSDYSNAERAKKRLSGTRKTELTAVILTLDDIARRGKLTASRVAPLFLTLERNTEWWTTGPLPSAGERTAFAGSQLVWQYYPGQGLQIQWLGTFGQLNVLAKRKSAKNNAQTARMVDEILPLTSARAGGLAWEYEFAFGGGAAPWVSSLSQGTGLQALARAAVKLGRQADIFPITQQALKIFQRRPPEGVRVGPRSGWDGPHYLQYSFAPGLFIINGFTQSIVGLHDYAQLSGDPTAQQLYQDGQAELAREVPEYDTGAWSLYSTGTSSYESNLNYHELLTGFLANMCDRVQVPVYCDTATRFTDYESEPPTLALAASPVHGGKTGTVRVRLSKISAVTVQISRDGEVVSTRSLGTIPYGLTRVRWSAPRHKGVYDVHVSARDLNGNTAARDGTVNVLKPVKKRKRG
jgi:D-glucuronyl C5-epimerase C-terminus